MTTGSDWQGRVGETWAQEWRRTDRSFAALSRHLDAAIAAVAPPGRRALDIGCGAGATTLALAAARPGLAVHSVDLSQGLVAIASRRAAEAGIDATFTVADAAALPAGQLYDLAFSRHGVMFFADPVAAFAAIRAGLVPGSALVFSCFRAAADNAWAVAIAEALDQSVSAPSDAPGPFAFADPDRVAAILAAAGWRDARPRAVDFPYHAGTDAEDALAFFRRIGPAARALAEAPEPAPLLARLHAMLDARQQEGTIDFPAAAWIWSARA